MACDRTFMAISIPCAALLATFLLLPSETAEAQVFKWKDANGRTHYSEHPPAEQQTQQIHSQPGPPTVDSDTNSPASQFMQQEEMERFARKSEEEDHAKLTAEREEAARKKRCVQAKNNLSSFQQQVRIFTLNNDGQKIFMDDNTRAAYIERAKKEIQKNCDSD